MQNFNYHSHTERCGHAVGSDEAYVKEAIKNGYRSVCGWKSLQTM